MRGEKAPDVGRLDAELASLRSLVEELQVARERVAEEAAAAPALAGHQAAELREHAQSLATVVEARAARVEEALEDALRQGREAGARWWRPPRTSPPGPRRRPTPRRPAP